MLKALVFDFDGVIVDTEMEWYNLYKDWLKNNYNYDLKMSDYQVCVGANSASLFEFIKKELGADVPIEEFEKKSVNLYIERTNKLPLMNGVKELVISAKKEGMKLAIATSAMRKKPETQLKRLGLYQCFDAFSTAELVKNIKPEPDLFVKAAEMLGCKTHECLAIEDSLNGLIAAQRANMPCLIVPNEITNHCEFKGYFMRITSLKDVNLDDIKKEYLKLE